MKKKLKYVLLIISVVFLGIHKGQGQIKEHFFYCDLSDVFIAKYQFKKAINALNNCYDKDLNNLRYLKKVGQCYFKLGRLKDAKLSYLKITEKNPNDVFAINQLGSIYFKEINYEKSLVQYLKLEKLDSLNGYYQKQISKLYLKLKDNNNAIKHYKKAHNLNPNDIEVIIELSKIYQELDVDDKANSLIEKGLLLDATNLRLIRLQVKLAYKQKKYSKTISRINYILENSKEEPSIYLLTLLGISKYYINDYKGAIKALTNIENILELKPATEMVYYYLGLSYRMSEDIKNSNYYIEKAINQGISDNISTYYVDLAANYKKNKDFEKTITAYQSAYQYSKDRILMYYLAVCYDLYYEDKSIAINYYNKYLDIKGPENMELMNYSKKRVRELKKINHFKKDTIH